MAGIDDEDSWASGMVIRLTASARAIACRIPSRIQRVTKTHVAAVAAVKAGVAAAAAVAAAGAAAGAAAAAG